MLAVPIGIAAGQNRMVSRIVKPVLDFMQTMPAFVYLIPAVTLFGLGTVPGVVATVIFAMPPGVRLTELGIRQVDREVVEAGEAFGASPLMVLARIKLPLAVGTIMAGVNQVIMLSLSMVVIAGMVGADGLGTTVTGAISQIQVGLGFRGRSRRGDPRDLPGPVDRSARRPVGRDPAASAPQPPPDAARRTGGHR